MISLDEVEDSWTTLTCSFRSKDLRSSNFKNPLPHNHSFEVKSFKPNLTPPKKREVFTPSLEVSLGRKLSGGKKWITKVYQFGEPVTY